MRSTAPSRMSTARWWLAATPPPLAKQKSSWLTGTAAWTFVDVSQYILGIQPTLAGLKIDPCIPHEMDGFTLRRVWRGATYEIVVENPDHLEKGVKAMTVDGKPVSGNILSPVPAGSTVEVKIVMGGPPAFYRKAAARSGLLLFLYGLYTPACCFANQKTPLSCCMRSRIREYFLCAACQVWLYREHFSASIASTTISAQRASLGSATSMVYVSVQFQSSLAICATVCLLGARMS